MKFYNLPHPIKHYKDNSENILFFGLASPWLTQHIVYTTNKNTDDPFIYHGPRCGFLNKETINFVLFCFNCFVTILFLRLFIRPFYLLWCWIMQVDYYTYFNETKTKRVKTKHVWFVNNKKLLS